MSDLWICNRIIHELPDDDDAGFEIEFRPLKKYQAPDPIDGLADVVKKAGRLTVVDDVVNIDGQRVSIGVLYLAAKEFLKLSEEK